MVDIVKEKNMRGKEELIEIKSIILGGLFGKLQNKFPSLSFLSKGYTANNFLIL